MLASSAPTSLQGIAPTPGSSTFGKHARRAVGEVVEHPSRARRRTARGTAGSRRQSPAEQRADAVAEVALAHAGHRRVDRDDERRVAGRACARDRSPRRPSRPPRHVELIPERTAVPARALLRAACRRTSTGCMRCPRRSRRAPPPPRRADRTCGRSRPARAGTADRASCRGPSCAGRSSGTATHLRAAGNGSSSNARQFSRSVISSSAPPSMCSRTRAAAAGASPAGAGRRCSRRAATAPRESREESRIWPLHRHATARIRHER